MDCRQCAFAVQIFDGKASVKSCVMVNTSAQIVAEKFFVNNTPTAKFDAERTLIKSRTEAIIMATISFEFSDKAYAVLEELADWRNMSVTEFARRALLEKMEDTEDLKSVTEVLLDDALVNAIPFEEAVKSWT